ncbi:hypothetical protein CI105_07575 [Candidatus Izimaplasma bacterium ZiA1]|uniref:class I SAM-dependent methyltransferase n=1 Tax=Candidatus Izimoplasma sp. ZiA1 TaxID=2024899 RepID=UPI000BAA62A4|nr:hypothetical protein CI105_07575 [Candidatus Izimaplasma bacterium ZiA1]
MSKKMYNEISELYDKIFPFSNQKLSFLKKYLDKGQILDLACGTGTYTIPLAIDNEMSGFDLDEGMIDIAKSKNNTSIDFRVKDMMSVDDVNKYNSIFSIGNSIVHVTDFQMQEKLFKSLNLALKENGKLVIQIVNYDRILDQNINELPTITNQGVSFTRKYNQKDDGLVDFITNISYKEMNETNQVTLLPMRKKMLESLLENSGFEVINTFGGFNEESFNYEKSFHLILICKKKYH